MVTQLVVLAGVVVGALASYLTTAATERSRWKRALDSRWDERRIEAYTSYAQAIKDIIIISTQIATGRGVAGSTGPSLEPTQENLDLLAAADTVRANLWETVLLLGHPNTVTAARNWHESVWRLEWFARGLLAGDQADWDEARSVVSEMRSRFYESARGDLQVKGGNLPDPGDHEARLMKIRGDSASRA